MEKMPSPLALTVKVTDIADIDPQRIFSDYVHKIVSFILEMNFLAASHGDLNPADFAISTAHLLQSV
jgi:hypothetical protein